MKTVLIAAALVSLTTAAQAQYYGNSYGSGPYGGFSSSNPYIQPYEAQPGGPQPYYQERSHGYGNTGPIIGDQDYRAPSLPCVAALGQCD